MADALPFDVPARLEDVDARFMTALLRHRGVISPTNEVIRIQATDVGMVWLIGD